MFFRSVLVQQPQPEQGLERHLQPQMASLPSAPELQEANPYSLQRQMLHREVLEQRLPPDLGLALHLQLQ